MRWSSLSDESALVPGVQVAQARHVEGDDADGAGEFRGPEQAVAALEEFAQVQLEAAAHGADHVRVEVGVDEVLEVGQTVFGGHLEETVSIGGVPVEVGGDVVGGDGEGERRARLHRPRS